ncbi:MAG: hypothetical protein HQ509_09975 [Candidatus Marinimicrobia bacterium]|nr:hypothetical protein [Candidatus Neomarinimicrobiota bacterium]
MKFRGNYILMFTIQFLGGFWTYYACNLFGLFGVIYGIIPFILVLIVVQAKYIPDERELSLIHKTENYQGIIVAVLMAIVYMGFPELNWFYIFVSSISVARGAIGVALFIIG